MLGLSACVNTDNGKIHNTDQQQIWQDSLKYVIVVRDSAHKISYLNEAPTSIDFDELRLADSLLTNAVESYNVKANVEYEKACKTHTGVDIRKEFFLIDLSKYVKQVVVYTNKAGEKEVWINCYRGDDVIKEIVDVNDGGNSFFNVRINLGKKLVYDFSVNGDA